MKKSHILVGLAILTTMGCQAKPILSSSAGVIQRLNSFHTPSIQAVIESKFNYSTDKATLTANFKDSDGQTTLYRTIKNGNQVKAETATLQNGQEVNKHFTTPNEAQLVIKVAASNGLADIYRDLKKRYELAGLTQ